MIQLILHDPGAIIGCIVFGIPMLFVIVTFWQLVFETIGKLFRGAKK